MFQRVSKDPAVRILFCFCILAVIAVSIVFFAARSHKAYGNGYQDKTCKSIQIKEGDTLWSIAKTYYVPECGSFTDYLKEIKNTNSLKSDSIHAGRYLLIPIYVTAN